MALEYAWDVALNKWVPLQLTTGAATAKYCTLRKTSTQSIPNGGIFTKVAPFNSAITGNNPAWGNYTTGEITIPATGWYGAQAIVEAAPGTGGVFKCSIFVNGSIATYLVMGEAARSAAYPDNVIWSSGASYMFNAGDKISLHVSNGFTAAVNVVDAFLTLFQQDVLVEESGGDAFVEIAGDTMTGPLTVNADLNVHGDQNEIEGTSGSIYTGSSRIGMEAYDGKQIRLLTWEGMVSVEGGEVVLSSDSPIRVSDAAGLSAQRIANVDDPIDPTDAANKAYVDANGGGGGGEEYLPLTGGTIDGSLAVENGGITAEVIMMGFDEITISTNDVNIQSDQVSLHSGSHLGLTAEGLMTLFSDQPIKITKLTGSSVPQRITNVDTPTGATDVATKGYTDARTPPILVLSAAAPVPGGTPAGTVIVRTVI